MFLLILYLLMVCLKPLEKQVCVDTHSSKKVKLLFGIFTLWYKIRLKTWRAKFSLRHAVHDRCMYIKTCTYLTHMLSILVRTFKDEGKEHSVQFRDLGRKIITEIIWEFWVISLFIFLLRVRSEVCHMMWRINTKCHILHFGFCAD